MELQLLPVEHSPLATDCGGARKTKLVRAIYGGFCNGYYNERTTWLALNEITNKSPSETTYSIR